MPHGDGLRSVRVWDLPTRLFHWLTAAFVLAAYITWRLIPPARAMPIRWSGWRVVCIASMGIR